MKTVTDVKRELRRIDKNLRGDEFDAGIVLLSATVVGPDREKLRVFTRLPDKTLDRIVTRCNRQGIFKGGRVSCDWMDKEGGGIAFACDIAVAVGYLNRSTKRGKTLAKVGS